MKTLLTISIFLMLFSCNQKEKMNTDNLRLEYSNLLKRLDWKTDFKTIESLLKPAIIIDQKTFKNEGKLGLSKFGGKPDLPKEMEWPRFKGRPMIFLAQINLAEIYELDTDDELPNEGIVYFFIHFNPPDKYGTEFQFLFDKNEYLVTYTEDQDLRSVDFPEDLISDYRFIPSRMEFHPYFTFPSSETLEIESLVKEDRENSYTFNDSNGNHEGEQILGHTMPIQNDVTWDWAFSHLNFKTFNFIK